ncbi:MAG: hypothetical protein IJ232_01535 [Lachnospiraceae bacterium]|nr:hypothetical protein [Lachnospiraceae bacterium]
MKIYYTRIRWMVIILGFIMLFQASLRSNATEINASGTLTLESPVTLEISGTRLSYLKFVPKESDIYYVAASSDNIDYVNVCLMDSSGFVLYSGGSDSLRSDNLYMLLEKDKVYYIGVQHISDEYTDKVTISCEKGCNLVKAKSSFRFWHSYRMQYTGKPIDKNALKIGVDGYNYLNAGEEIPINYSIKYAEKGDIEPEDITSWMTGTPTDLGSYYLCITGINEKNEQTTPAMWASYGVVYYEAKIGDYDDLSFLYNEESGARTYIYSNGEPYPDSLIYITDDMEAEEDFEITGFCSEEEYNGTSTNWITGRPTNVGKYYLRIEGIGQYHGECYMPAEIKKDESYLNNIENYYGDVFYTYTGKDISYSVRSMKLRLHVNGQVKELVGGVDFIYRGFVEGYHINNDEELLEFSTTKSMVDPGEYTVKLEGITVSGTKYVDIWIYDEFDNYDGDDSFEYTGRPIDLSNYKLTFKDKSIGKELIYGEDFVCEMYRFCKDNVDDDNLSSYWVYGTPVYPGTYELKLDSTNSDIGNGIWGFGYKKITIVAPLDDLDTYIGVTAIELENYTISLDNYVLYKNKGQADEKSIEYGTDFECTGYAAKPSGATSETDYSSLEYYTGLPTAAGEYVLKLVAKDSSEKVKGTKFQVVTVTEPNIEPDEPDPINTCDDINDFTRESTLELKNGTISLSDYVLYKNKGQSDEKSIEYGTDFECTGYVAKPSGATSETDYSSLEYSTGLPTATGEYVLKLVAKDNSEKVTGTKYQVVTVTEPKDNPTDEPTDNPTDKPTVNPSDEPADNPAGTDNPGGEIDESQTQVSDNIGEKSQETDTSQETDKTDATTPGKNDNPSTTGESGNGEKPSPTGGEGGNGSSTTGGGSNEQESLPQNGTDTGDEKDVKVEKTAPNIEAKDIKKTLGSKAFNLKLKTNSDGKITYSSSNKKVANISSNGKISLKNYGKAVITIKVEETDNYTSAEKKVKVTVVPAKVKIKKLYSPTNNKFYLSWKKIKGVSGYEFSYSKKKNRKKRVSLKNRTYYSAILPGSSGDKAYFSVRAYVKVGGKKYYGEWSKYKKVRMK